MMCKIISQRGISIIAAVFTLIILGIFGMTLVVLVSTGHESRAAFSSSVVAFYDTQAGFEYAIREIDQGGYPLVSGKSFSRGAFTTQIIYSETANDYIRVTGTVGGVQKKYQIRYSSFAGDCTAIDYSGVTLGGFNNNVLSNLMVKKTCNEGISVAALVNSWVPNNGEKLVSIKVDGVPIWADLTGLSSGQIADVMDTRIIDAVNHPMVMEFSSSMKSKTITMRFVMTDSSTKTVSFFLP